MAKDGTNYYAAIGPVRAPLALVSGPPVYVFDRSGTMVDWTLDNGEDPRFQKAWSAFSEKRISIAELDELMKQNVEQGGSPYSSPAAGSESGDL